MHTPKHTGATTPKGTFCEDNSLCCWDGRAGCPLWYRTCDSISYVMSPVSVTTLKPVSMILQCLNWKAVRCLAPSLGVPWSHQIKKLHTRYLTQVVFFLNQLIWLTSGPAVPTPRKICFYYPVHRKWLWGREHQTVKVFTGATGSAILSLLGLTHSYAIKESHP